MIDCHAAIAIADQHIASQPAPLDGYRVVRFDPCEIDEGWYFDYGIECDLDISDSEHELFAGAPGFIVDRTHGHLRIVSHHERSTRVV